MLKFLRNLNIRPTIFGFICTLILLSSQSAWAIAGKIQNVIGTARVSKHTGQQYPAVKGDNLYEGDTVATGSNSNVQIRMVDEALIWLRPNTEFKITTYRSTQHGHPKNEAALRLLAGSMRSVTGVIGRANLGDYKLSTPAQQLAYVAPNLMRCMQLHKLQLIFKQRRAPTTASTWVARLCKVPLGRSI